MSLVCGKLVLGLCLLCINIKIKFFENRVKIDFIRKLLIERVLIEKLLIERVLIEKLLIERVLIERVLIERVLIERVLIEIYNSLRSLLP